MLALTLSDALILNLFRTRFQNQVDKFQRRGTLIKGKSQNGEPFYAWAELVFIILVSYHWGQSVKKPP